MARVRLSAAVMAALVIALILLVALLLARPMAWAAAEPGALGEGRSAQPEGRFTQPEGRLAQPEGRPAQPEGRSAQPEGRSAQPDPDGSETALARPRLTSPTVSQPVAPADTSGLPPAPSARQATGRPAETRGRADQPRPVIHEPQSADPVVQRSAGPATMPAPLHNFEGVGNLDSVLPPDTDGQVGPNHFVQMVNLHTAVYNKTTGLLLYGPFAPNNLWPPGDVCRTHNDGDPVVLYDQLADRWILTQFAVPDVGPYYECVAVSKGPTPTNNPGDWWPYTFQVHPNKFNDYPKFAVWPDGYYMTANQYPDVAGDRYTAGAWVFDRSKMLNGQPASFQYFDLGDLSPVQSHWALLPSNLLGNTPPPGTPNYLASIDQDWAGADDVLHLFAFHTDWADPANSTLTLVKDLVVAEYDGVLCNGDRNCIPQPGTAQGVDSLAPRLMMHLWYRSFADYAVLMTNHTVDVGTNHAGIRWYEIRDPGPHAYVLQQGTFAPDQHHRWMGSIAMDRVGNMALGYSISSSTMYPSVRYTGRLAGDPLGEMAQGEMTVINGGGSQTHSAARWGDYSAMSVDPVDDCTFWYTQQYIQTTGSATWQTRIASFRFPNCLGPTGRLTGVVGSASGGPIANAKVVAASGLEYVTYSYADGSFGFPVLPPGSYTLTAVAYGFQQGTIVGVPVNEDGTTAQNLELTALPAYVVEGTVTDATAGWPVYGRIQIRNYPGDAVWTDPATGYYSITLASETPFTFTVSTWAGGYLPTSRAVGPLAGGTTESFALAADEVTCAAPGYQTTEVAYQQGFESNNGGYAHGGTLDEWEWGRPAVWPGDCAVGSKCWGTDLDANYNDDANYSLTSPEIDLSAVSPGDLVTVRWWQAWAVEASIYDTLDAEVSINGGGWTPMWSHVGSTTKTDWTQMAYNISAAAGGLVRFRWRLTSDGGLNFEGYYLDEVVIAVGCDQVPGGLVVGHVLDENTLEPLNAVNVSNDSGSSTVTQPTPDDDSLAGGFFMLFTPAGAHTLTATHGNPKIGYGPDTVALEVAAGSATRQDFYLPAGKLIYAPPGLDVTLDRDMAVTRPLTLTNVGGVAARFSLAELDPELDAAGPSQLPDAVIKPFKARRLTAERLTMPAAPTAPVMPDPPVIDSWSSGLDHVWGLGYDSRTGSIWLGDVAAGGGDDRDHRFLPDGTATGDTIDTAPWVDTFAGDLTYNPHTGMLWQVNVAGDQCIYELDPVDRVATGNRVCPAFFSAQRGLAYDPTTDTFFAGGWNDNMVYRFAADGTMLAREQTNLAIAGLAYNPDTRHLFATTSSESSAIYVLDVGNEFAPTGQFSIPGMRPWGGAGLAMDCSGSLWAADQQTGTVFRVDSGETTSACTADIAWLSLSATTGMVPSQESRVASVTLDPTVPGLLAGQYRARIRVSNDTPYGAVLVPITMTINPAYRVALTAAPEAAWGAAGTAADYAVQVTNTGNTTDTFGLSVDALWATTLSRPAVTLAAGSASEVRVQVAIPGSAAAGEYDVAAITVESQSDDHATASAAVTTTAAAYAVTLTPATDAGSAAPGAAVTYTLQMTNAGSVTDTFDLEFQDNTWATNLSEQQVRLGSGQGTTITVQATVAPEALAGESDTVLVRAVSRAEPTAAGEATLTTTASAVYGVTLNPAADEQDGEIGGVVTYTLRVSNIGNAADTFDLVPTGPWAALLSDAEVTLAARAETGVAVRVTVPQDAADGEKQDTVITITSRHDPSANGTSRLTTTATRTEYTIYLPLTIRGG